MEDTFVARVPKVGLVVDVGCGPGLDCARFVGLGLRVIGFDLSEGMLSLALRVDGARYVQGDLRTLPLRSGQFDGIWCVASLLHVPEIDTSSFLLGFRRILREGGSLALITAVGDGERFEEVPYADGERRWFVYRNPERLCEQLSGAGFRIDHARDVSGSRRWFTALAHAR